MRKVRTVHVKRKGKLVEIPLHIHQYNLRRRKERAEAKRLTKLPGDVQ